mmetsp:Transcript_4166/g.11739  ORF Transcript_4166/g.11739 Transcript_4166/m.11739 type:complete len:217 (+) Transcript_4166:76-726(+)|eukprot:CAMPEP_0117666278 /NCGR_PEP_ID=MMETSP0804-20121206/10284_1 /TAXON_ID=1074897 /ORGANISM="Tetraselmis astigmatica, Strain CCMP880" /LENGTH=216 /DNA_ID=CAMNT_0005473799 /DNA_START=67 /DNA_END=717 /DNA_ORIENTATION=-
MTASAGRHALAALGRASGLLGAPAFAACETSLAATACAGSQLLSTRNLGRTGVPEYFAKKSPYTDGAEFLGTPRNHDELLKKRPLSPDVLNTHPGAPFVHYDFPLAAISSIVNRVTGAGLSVGFAGIGALALVTDVPTLLEMYKTAFPLLVIPTKAVVAFPFVYHTIGGLRHMYWDQAKLGNNADKTSPLDLKQVASSSVALLGASAVVTLGVAAL